MIIITKEEYMREFNDTISKVTDKQNKIDGEN